MDVKTLWILRGVSGSGKTTLDDLFVSQFDECVSVAADDYFYDINGDYNFDANRLSAAHADCKRRVLSHITNGVANIVVHNTNTTDTEIAPYIHMGEDHGYQIMCLVVENRHGNKDTHNVPDMIKMKQAGRLRQSINLF